MDRNLHALDCALARMDRDAGLGATTTVVTDSGGGDSGGGFWSSIGSGLNEGLTSLADSIKTTVKGTATAAADLVRARIAEEQKRTASALDAARNAQGQQARLILGMQPGKAALAIGGGVVLLATVVVLARRRRRR